MKSNRKESIDKNKNKSEFEKKLPKDVHHYLFRFFNQVELRNIASVNKLFSQLSHQEIERLKTQYKNNIFYTVGNPIQISDPNRSFFDMDLWMKHRDNISDKDIYESFLGKNINQLQLFKTEEEALEYSRFLRKGDQLLQGTEVYQPAVFKVIYLGDVNQADLRKEDLIINKGCWSTANEWCERRTQVSYMETDRKQVIPLEGVLKIHLSKLGEFKTHGPIDYANLAFVDEEINPTFSCKHSCQVS